MPVPFVALGGPHGVVLAARFGIAGIGLGLACGLARERSGSVVAPVALHAVAAVVVWPVLLAAAQYGP
jgi:membrane protease YdiL (CAAX protease family)